MVFITLGIGHLARRLPNMLNELKSRDFFPYLNQKFRIQLAAVEPLEVELIEVTDLTSASGSENESSTRLPFSIVFRGPKEPSLPQNIYDIEHDKMGTLNLFIVPIGPDSEGMLYEAVFS